MFSSVFDAYKKLSGSDIEDSIEGETTGNLENLLLAVGKTCDLSAISPNSSYTLRMAALSGGGFPVMHLKMNHKKKNKINNT